MPNLENENQSKRLINCAEGFHVFGEPSSSVLPFGPVGSFSQISVYSCLSRLMQMFLACFLMYNIVDEGKLGLVVLVFV